MLGGGALFPTALTAPVVGSWFVVTLLCSSVADSDRAGVFVALGVLRRVCGGVGA